MAKCWCFANNCFKASVLEKEVLLIAKKAHKILGCKEIYKNDTLNIGSNGNEYKANIYQTHAPRYIPY